MSGVSDCSVAEVAAADYGTNATGDVVVTSDTGALVTRTNGFTYMAAGSITSVTPNAGASGTLVTIQGVELYGGGTGVTRVLLGGQTAFLSRSDSSAGPIVVVAQAGTGVGDVVVVGNTGVTVRLVNGWTYSSIDSATCGKSSLTSRPDLPCFWNFHGDASRFRFWPR